MVEVRYSGDVLWQRIQHAVEKVKDRLARVTRALEAADIDYAVIGGNAVQLWVAQVDESAVRNTRDVDILIRESDLPRAIEALSPAGFNYRKSAGVDMFLDGPDARARDAVRIVFSSKKVREDYEHPAPDVNQIQRMKDMRTLTLDALVRMKLTSYRDQDRTHLRDLLEVGLLDASWLPGLPDDLRQRLKELIDTPDG